MIRSYQGKSPNGASRIVRVAPIKGTPEFVCKVYDNGEWRPGLDYFTEDLDDAIATAQVMVFHVEIFCD